MSNNEWKKWIGVVGRMLLAYALLFVQGAWAGQDQKAKDKVDSPQKAAPQQTSEKASTVGAAANAEPEEVQGKAPKRVMGKEKPSGDGSQEGVKVHGHWSIDICNPDGTLVKHREFENAYASGTANPLSTILSGQGGPLGPWQLQILGNADVGPVHIGDITVQMAAVTVLPSGQVVVAGSVTANPQDPSWVLQSITEVRSLIFLGCVQGVPPSLCGYQYFSRAFPTPVQIFNGQIIQVAVTFSFS